MDLSKMEEARALVKEIDRNLKEAELIQRTEEELRPHWIAPTQFMEVRNLVSTRVMINIESISEIIPLNRIIDGLKTELTRIVFINGEDLAANHTYDEIMAEIRQYIRR